MIANTLVFFLNLIHAYKEQENFFNRERIVFFFFLTFFILNKINIFLNNYFFFLSLFLIRFFFFFFFFFSMIANTLFVFLNYIHAYKEQEHFFNRERIGFFFLLTILS